MVHNHLAMQGTRVYDPWSGKIPRALGQLSPCTTTAEPLEPKNCSFCACVPELPKPGCPKTRALQRERPARRSSRKPALRNERGPRSAARENPRSATREARAPQLEKTRAPQQRHARAPQLEKSLCAATRIWCSQKTKVEKKRKEKSSSSQTH